MEKKYNPRTIEEKYYQAWEKNHYFAPTGHGKPYCIMLPPPNVTGNLHMGHGFCFTLMDILIRYHRMQGDNTLWQPGTDHAGIATQMVVERQLMIEECNRHDLGREKFVEKIWQWKEESGGTITKQLRRLGYSLDWSREHFTMDESLSRTVSEVFIRLYEEGYIYRGMRLVNWDPKLLTAISDLEVLNQEEEGQLWHIRYPFENGSDYLTVATTRPETLFGDVAIAVNPNDKRYQKLIGQRVQLPLTERLIPIIADDYVEPEFGSGCVKITPAHDFNDYAVGQRHNLNPINILTPDAHLNQEVPKPYQNLERFAARKQVIKDLENLGLLEKTEKHLLKVPRGDRSGVIIEPYLTEQWFVKMQSLAAPAIQAVKDNKIRFIPDNWSKTYFQWLENIEDWCISRQLWWGHRIPAWFDEKGQIYVGENENSIRVKYQLDSKVKLRQDSDVLDTWFSSALWPFSSLGWPEQTIALKTFYPTSVLVTGFDIIFFWVARMIMMGLKFVGEVPFKEIYITGLIRDTHGHKMSKSKGNVLDPLDLIDGICLEDLIAKRTRGLMQPAMAQKIEKITRTEYPNGIAAYGTDALRLTFCALASNNREIRFDLARLEGYRHFCNKLWNAARYVIMNIENETLTDHPSQPNEIINRWILSQLQTTMQMMAEALNQYRFDLFAQSIYEFVWNEFCDWYVELSKPLLTGSHAAVIRQETKQTLVTVLENILRLLHPIMPFITEEIWLRIIPMLGITAKTIMLQPYPQFNPEFKDEHSEQEIIWLKNIIVAIRTLRSEIAISPAKIISILLNKGSLVDKKRLAAYEYFITSLAKVEKMTWLSSDNERPIDVAITVVGELELFIPLAGLIDKKIELERLSREKMKLHKEIERCEGKLQNAHFIERAPYNVVEKERDRLTELKNRLAKLIN